MHFLYLWSGWGEGTPNVEPAVLFTGRVEAVAPRWSEVTAPLRLEVACPVRVEAVVL